MRALKLVVVLGLLLFAVTNTAIAAQENPITEYTEHSIPITIFNDEITLGETTISQLELPQEEMEIETEEHDADQGIGGIIPGYPQASIILGLSIILILFRKSVKSST